jgi:hypothetical protein
MLSRYKLQHKPMTSIMCGFAEAKNYKMLQKYWDWDDHFIVYILLNQGDWKFIRDMEVKYTVLRMNKAGNAFMHDEAITANVLEGIVRLGWKRHFDNCKFAEQAMRNACWIWFEDKCRPNGLFFQ